MGGPTGINSEKQGGLLNLHVPNFICNMNYDDQEYDSRKYLGTCISYLIFCGDEICLVVVVVLKTGKR